MTWLVRAIAAAGLGFVLVYGGTLLKDPAFELRWAPVQGFQRVSADRLPAPAPAWTHTDRMLSKSALWPERSAVLEELIRTKNDGADFEFPVLVPVQVAEDALALAASALRYEQLDKGYYVVFDTRHMEIMIIGTAAVHHAEDDAVTDAGQDYVSPYQDPGPRPAGGRITFGHFGADYAVTFDCKVTDPGLKKNCMTKSGAHAFVMALIEGTPAPIFLPDYEGS